ncbi:Crp/Fnr family transcriptional regulator [bacterium]|nr:Crp/Fnr family transcriptional regulator [bacterium]
MANNKFCFLDEIRPVLIQSKGLIIEFTVLKGERIEFKRNGKLGFCVLLRGHCALERRVRKFNHTLQILGPGDISGFGSWWDLSDAKYDSLVALSTGRLGFISEDSFRDLQEVVPNLSEMMLKLLCQSIKLKDLRISALESFSVRSRVSSLLISLSKKFGVSKPHGVLIDVVIGRDRLALLSATSVESFSRALSEFREDGIIQKSGRKIFICDQKGLERLVE